MSRENKKIVRQYVGEIPLLKSIIKKIGFEEILTERIGTHGNEKVPIAESIMLLIYNLTCGREPLYRLGEWVANLDPALLDKKEPLDAELYNDDRFGRALDKLYDLDRSALMTEIVTKMVKETNLDLSKIHNDSTTIKAYGKIPGETKSGVKLAKGHSKDHRPDLKQIVYSLTIAEDGAVPIHHKTYAGNRTDDTTHIETWNTIRKFYNKTDFLYVADCKLCTSHQLEYITERDGRVITLIPKSWKEVKEYKDFLRKARRKRKVIWNKKIGKNHSTGKPIIDKFSCFVGKKKTIKHGYPIYWIHSSEKMKTDCETRQIFLEKTETALTQLMRKLNKRGFKTKEQINDSVNKILKHFQTERFYHIKINEETEEHSIQLKQGRPDKDTKYKTWEEKIFSLSWARNKKALLEEKNVDGIFPLLCTDEKISAKEALIAYKYQPKLEKRFQQFKSVHKGAPLLFKKVERVEAIMFLFFLALMVQALVEREVRSSMKIRKLDNIPVYPEHRVSYQPTTARIFDRFDGISKYQVFSGDDPPDNYQDELKDLQLTILKLLNIPETKYWQGFSAK